MRKNNKFFSITLAVLAAALVISFTGCNKSPATATEKPGSSNPAQTQKPDSKYIFTKFNQAETIYVVPVASKGFSGKALNPSEKLLLQSLQGIVAQRKAEIYLGNATDRFIKYVLEQYNVKLDDGKYVYSVDANGETVKTDSTNTWIRSLPDLVKHYVQSGDLQGYVKMKFVPNKYNQQTSQVNQACTLAGLNKWLIVPTDIEAALNTAVSELKMGFDLSTTNLSEYDVIKQNLDKLNLDVLIMQAPPRTENLREYGIAAKAPFYFYNSNTPESEKDYVYKNMNMLANAFGWEQVDVKEDGIAMGNMEDNSVDFASKRDVNIIAADWSTNLSVWGSLPKKPVKQKETVKYATDNEQVHYVTFVYSDGDNIQWMSNGGFAMEHLQSVKADKKEMPFGWSLTPNLVETLPHMIKYIYDTATDKESFVVSVSGYSYNHPKYLSDEALTQYAKGTGSMMADADMKYIAMKGVDERVMDAFATQDQIKGGFVMYGAWDKKPGYIYWQNNKPFVHDRVIFWKDRGNESDPAYMGKNWTKLKYFSTDKTKASGYTFVQVHCWSYKYSQIQKTFWQDLDKTKVKVVTPNEFQELIVKNVKPENGKFQKPSDK